MKRWLPLLLATLLLTLGAGATGAYVLGQKIVSDAASGADGFLFTVNGAQLHLGTGSNDFLFSDGTKALTIGNFGANAFVSTNNNSVAIIASGSNVGASLTGAVSMGAGTNNATSINIAVGTVNKNITPVGNGADTTEDNLMTYALPNNSMNTDTTGIRVTAWGDGVLTANATTVRCYFGATAIITTVLTAAQANTWRVTGEVLRTGAATQTSSVTMVNGGTADLVDQENAAPTETLSGPVTIKCTGQRATTSTANSVRQLGMIVEMLN